MVALPCHPASFHIGCILNEAYPASRVGMAIQRKSDPTCMKLPRAPTPENSTRDSTYQTEKNGKLIVIGKLESIW